MYPRRYNQSSSPARTRRVDHLIKYLRSELFIQQSAPLRILPTNTRSQSADRVCSLGFLFLLPLKVCNCECESFALAAQVKKWVFARDFYDVFPKPLRTPRKSTVIVIVIRAMIRDYTRARTKANHPADVARGKNKKRDKKESVRLYVCNWPELHTAPSIEKWWGGQLWCHVCFSYFPHVAGAIFFCSHRRWRWAVGSDSCMFIFSPTPPLLGDIFVRQNKK